MQVIHLFKCLCLIFNIVLWTTASFAQENNFPVAFAGNIAGDTASTRFFLDFDKKLTAQTFYMDNPNRIIIDLDETVFNLANNNSLQPRGLIESVQFGRISAGRSRVVLTLALPVEIIKASLSQKLDDDTFRFLLDMDSTDEQTFSALLKQQHLTLGTSGNVAQKGDRVIRSVPKSEGRFVIVVDPGHGGIDGGAVGRRGTQEKDVVFSFAKKLRTELQKIGPFDVKMTREDDVFVSLRNRLDFGRRNKADLFISLHADSLRQRFVRGSTIYTLSKKASDQLSQRLAESENRADLVAGLVVEEEVEAVTDILVDLTTRETKRFSKRFSSLLVRNLGSEVRLIKNPQRSAAFGVLKAPEVPSVLIELGYLSNEEDEKLLKSNVFQEKASKAISKSVLDFFEGRL